MPVSLHLVSRRLEPSCLFQCARVSILKTPVLLSHPLIPCLLFFIYMIQVYFAKRYSMLHATLDVEVTLCNYSLPAVTALDLAAALAGS